MYARIVTFQLAGLTEAEYRQRADAIASLFNEWPGLHAKLWLADGERNRYGGFYVFASEADANASRSTELFNSLACDPNIAGIEIQEFDILAAPTSVTARAVVAALAATPA